ncbi:MAG: Do family serine endopeptidase [Candidatus Omnitrophica bacterium]|nr:Do family serine endopeptidase [Candidatus Omnitrophota bacterium]
MRITAIVSVCIICSMFALCGYGQGYKDLENATIKVATQVGPAVVSISAVIKEKAGGVYFNAPFGSMEDDTFRRFFDEFFGEIPQKEFQRTGLGSGVIINNDGYILTNEHVIAGASDIKVKLSDGREFAAEVKGSDPRSDLAVIKIDARDLPVAPLGDSVDLKIGQWVVAVGNPFGFAINNPEPTVTVGVISALHRFLPALGRRDRSYDDLIQTDAAINPGNSGGPLVNLEGKIIGINTAIITTTGGYQGLGFAIPVDQVKNILKKLIRGETISYGWLGVNIQDLNDDLRSYFGIKESTGVIVVKVFSDSPSEKAGIKEGDLILGYNDQDIKTTRDLVRIVTATPVGEKIPVKILRAGKEMTVRVKIGVRPDSTREEENPSGTQKSSFRGMQVEEITPYAQQRFMIQEKEGVVVSFIQPDSPADRGGLETGDVIVNIEGKPIKNKRDFESVTSRVKGSCLIKTNKGYVVIREEENK